MMTCPKCGRTLFASDPNSLAQHEASYFCQAGGDWNKVNKMREAEKRRRRDIDRRRGLVQKAAETLALRDPTIRAALAHLPRGSFECRRALSAHSTGFEEEAEHLVAEAERVAGPGADGHAMRSALLAMLRERKPKH